MPSLRKPARSPKRRLGHVHLLERLGVHEDVVVALAVKVLLLARGDRRFFDLLRGVIGPVKRTAVEQVPQRGADRWPDLCRA